MGKSTGTAKPRGGAAELSRGFGWLAVLGVGAYRSAFADRRAAPGRQDRTIGETRVWLLPNTSGLNAHCRPEDFVRHFAALRQAVRATSY